MVSSIKLVGRNDIVASCLAESLLTLLKMLKISLECKFHHLTFKFKIFSWLLLSPKIKSSTWVTSSWILCLSFYIDPMIQRWSSLACRQSFAHAVPPTWNAPTDSLFLDSFCFSFRSPFGHCFSLPTPTHTQDTTSVSLVNSLSTSP